MRKNCNFLRPLYIVVLIFENTQDIVVKMAKMPSNRIEILKQ